MLSNKYKSIFEHYGLENSIKSYNQQEINDRYLLKIQKDFIQRNENNKKKKINAKTTKNKLDQKLKTKDNQDATKLTVPDSTKKRRSRRSENSNVSSPIPIISVHNPSSSTIPVITSNIESNTVYADDSTSVSSKQQTLGTPSIIVKKLSDDLKSLWDLDELNRFTRDMFKYSGKNIHDDSKQHSHRPRLNCATDQDQNLDKYVKSRTHCLDIFDEYVTTIKQQHGFIRSAATDPPMFEPAISVTGPDIKKDPTRIDREDSNVIKKLHSIEPRKKYSLIHETAGIFIIGGYNLFVDIPIQREPDCDYLFKHSGGVTKLPPLQPCRANFAIYTNGSDIYVAGGQTIYNELLDDVQRMNMKTLKWEHITTLTGPIAACGLYVDENRVYIAGGYDILVGKTNFLSDYSIYDMSTGKLENANDLPSPRCRTLVFVFNQAVFCISGLIEGHNENNNKKLKISTDILKWTRKIPLWIKVSQTPELTKFHALSFNEPYLQITKRLFAEQNDETNTLIEAYYDFRTNTWTNGRAPATSGSQSPKKKSKSGFPSKTSP